MKRLTMGSLFDGIGGVGIRDRADMEKRRRNDAQAVWSVLMQHVPRGNFLSGHAVIAQSIMGSLKCYQSFQSSTSSLNSSAFADFHPSRLGISP